MALSIESKLRLSHSRKPQWVVPVTTSEKGHARKPTEYDASKDKHLRHFLKSPGMQKLQSMQKRLSRVDQSNTSVPLEKNDLSQSVTSSRGSSAGRSTSPVHVFIPPPPMLREERRIKIQLEREERERLRSNSLSFLSKQPEKVLPSKWSFAHREMIRKQQRLDQPESPTQSNLDQSVSHDIKPHRPHTARIVKESSPKAVGSSTARIPESTRFPSMPPPSPRVNESLGRQEESVRSGEEQAGTLTRSFTISSEALSVDSDPSEKDEERAKSPEVLVFRGMEEDLSSLERVKILLSDTGEFEKFTSTVFADIADKEGKMRIGGFAAFHNQAARKLGNDPDSEAEIKELFHEMDEDDRGFITLKEFRGEVRSFLTFLKMVMK